jgi:hypothetical protein
MSTSLADRAIADSHIASTVFTGRARKALEAGLLALRIDLKNAHRFELDDDFVRLATEVSFGPAERVLARTGLAHLPYATTWIEFNLHAKVQAAIDHGMSQYSTLRDVPERLGVLFKRDPDRPTAWTAILVGEILLKAKANDHVVVPQFWGFSFDADQLLTHQKMAAVIGPRIGINNPQVRTLMTAWGYYSKDSDMLSEVRALSFDQLDHHGEPIIPELYHEAINHNQIPIDSIEFTLRESVGFLRWLVTVLAILNEVPTTSAHVQPSGTHRVGLGRKPLLDFHRLTLNLPGKLKPRGYIERRLGHSERHHRAHEVRSHWRTYPSAHAGGCPEHAWIFDHENGYRLCERCESFGRLIAEHIRGDESLGWVDKEYLIKGQHVAPDNRQDA